MVSPSSDLLFRKLAAFIFYNPDLLVQAHWHHSIPALTVREHRHPDLLQLDYYVGFSGYFTHGKLSIPIKPVTAIVTYPGQLHSIVTKPEHAKAEIYSFKIRTPRNKAWIRKPLFPSHIYCLAADTSLIQALRELVWGNVSKGIPPSKLCTILIRALQLWPLNSKVDLQKKMADPIGERLSSVLLEIEKRMMNPPTIKELAPIAFMSDRHLIRSFRSYLGCTPHEYITARRMERARELLAHTNLNITEAAENLGFPDIHTFSRWFRREEGVSPNSFKASNRLL